MRRETPRIKVEETDRLDLYGPAFVILASCRCGHGSELFSHSAIRRFGLAVTVGQYKAHLRCAQCGARMPEISVSRRPRD
jgi:hypothetical protein